MNRKKDIDELIRGKADFRDNERKWERIVVEHTENDRVIVSSIHITPLKG